MPDQLFTYYIENHLLIIFINSGIWGGRVIWLDIEIWVPGKGDTIKGGLGIGVGAWGEEVWGLLGFMALVHVWLYFCCCSGGYLCQGL
jgi:hypothetical protein